jgi:DNA polymerase III subunit beta
MKFACSKEALLKEISVAQEVISSKNSLSVLSNVLLTAEDGSLKVQATDLKVGFEVRIPVEVERAGTTTAFCDRLLNIVRSLPDGDVEIEQVDPAIVRINPVGKKIDFQLRCIPSDKYPEIPKIGDDMYFDFPQADFVQMVSKTLFAVSDDETRYFMNGIYLEKSEDMLVMVATDGRRLAFITRKIPVPLENLKGIIIPPKILTIVRKLSYGEGNLSLSLTDKNLFVKIGNNRLSSNLIEGQFPDYRRVIPESQKHRAIVERKVIEEALRRVSLLVEQKSRKIVLTIQKDAIVIHSKESELGVAKEEISCEYDGPETSLAVNCLYMMEPIREMDSEKMAIEFTDLNKAITLKSQPEDGYLNIVMPMQLD